MTFPTLQLDSTNTNDRLMNSYYYSSFISKQRPGTLSCILLLRYHRDQSRIQNASATTTRPRESGSIVINYMIMIGGVCLQYDDGKLKIQSIYMLSFPFHHITSRKGCYRLYSTKFNMQILCCIKYYSAHLLCTSTRRDVTATNSLAE